MTDVLFAGSTLSAEATADNPLNLARSVFRLSLTMKSDCTHAVSRVYVPFAIGDDERLGGSDSMAEAIGRRLLHGIVLFVR